MITKALIISNSRNFYNIYVKKVGEFTSRELNKGLDKMTKDEALKMAIEELMNVVESCNKGQVHFDGDDFHETLEACRKALEQPTQEKKYLYAHSYDGLIVWSESRNVYNIYANKVGV